ncbi:hypothetical protein CO678_41315 [Bradyrhizobium diazoefficiens]|nr:hypothetical protein CO678_41315 [Bradyrhizobium diazoefficiens]
MAPKEADHVRFREPPAYVLTIENLASFNRHVAEADAARLGATLYVGGYPSLASQQALRTISAMVSEQTPIFHWSDIDPDGTWIFHTMERAVGRPILPHLGAGADQKVRTRSLPTKLRHRFTGGILGQRWIQDPRAGGA